jgi:hypothetical protein
MKSNPLHSSDEHMLLQAVSPIGYQVNRHGRYFVLKNTKQEQATRRERSHGGRGGGGGVENQ